MGVFDWFFGTKEKVREKVERSVVEEALAKKYAASFSKPKKAGSTELVTMFNQCKEDLKYVRDPELINAINYYAIECLDAYLSHLIGVSAQAFKKRNFYLMFDVLKRGLSVIDLSRLTLPEIEEISPIIKTIASTNTPEEFKFFKAVETGNYVVKFELQIENPLSIDAIERILDFCKTYRDILDMMNKAQISLEIPEKTAVGEELELSLPESRCVFGNYLVRESNILNFINDVEKYLKFLQKSAGSTIETFRDDYLCHVSYGGGSGIWEILNTRLFFERQSGLWFYVNEVHSTNNPAIICCLADVLEETKERGLKFAIVTEKNDRFEFLPKYNLFYNEQSNTYLTFKEIKDIIKTGKHTAVIYYNPALKDNRLRAPGVCVLDRPAEDYARFAGRSAAGFKPKYAIYQIQKVNEADTDPAKRMFSDIFYGAMYLMNTSEGKQILRSMLEAQK